jgi:aubergine-like protein
MAIGGLAIYHKLINKNESCAAFVGSTDHDLSTYYSFAKLMPQNTQRVDSLHEMMIGWLRSYFKKNKDLPELLLLYRDGVGEGQIKGIIDV